MRFEPAPVDRLSKVEHLAPRFFREILEWDYSECFVTDESELSDFATVTDPLPERQAAVQRFLDRVQEHYYLRRKPTGTTRIVDILEFLEAQGVTE